MRIDGPSYLAKSFTDVVKWREVFIIERIGELSVLNASPASQCTHTAHDTYMLPNENGKRQRQFKCTHTQHMILTRCCPMRTERDNDNSNFKRKGFCKYYKTARHSRVSSINLSKLKSNACTHVVGNATHIRHGFIDVDFVQDKFEMKLAYQIWSVIISALP